MSSRETLGGAAIIRASSGPPPTTGIPDADIDRIRALIAFFVAYKFARHLLGHRRTHGRHALLLALGLAATRKVPKMHLHQRHAGLGVRHATLILHDVRFIQWKATVFYWLVGVVFVGSIWIGKKTLLERLMTAGASRRTSPSGFHVAQIVAGRGAFLPGAGRREHLGGVTMSEKTGCSSRPG